ncbi:hypothetical protein CKM354_000726100 [Cercospora kikuchii]|uniref:Uncharacterized protein n=1 Tax=Cercospora kikuchii TaxID=84275 RepID=A0A9P3CIW1_9PEZI|nr:uncharacterized protein CKM354_000726100 [Cercospora kikuchii]GIZ44052.1 hypothetical protein CKM354_000726100 [Cercospora kikuchii]
MLRPVVCLMLALASYVATAESDSGSVPLFIDNMNPNAQWAASIENACDGSTTYVVSMTSAPFGNAGQVATITEGSDFFRVTSAAIYSETSATMHESCALDTAKSSASCIVTVVDDNYGPTPLSKTISYNLTGTGYYQYDVQITGGAKRTANGGTCQTSAAQSSFTSSPSAVVLFGSFLAMCVIGLLWM